MKDSLHVLYRDAMVGSIIYDRKKDEITLNYEESWRFADGGFPMSLSLPLTKKSHADAQIRPFLQGLLPDNPAVVQAWGKRFYISPRNPFDVIKHVGEDCAGALQFVRPERSDLILSGDLDSLSPLSEEDLAMRMRDLKSQARAVPTRIEGRFSLAGAQTKDALHWKNGQWFVPAGRIPSTHILKPELEEFEEHALNEHFCLQLAARIGLMRTDSRVLEIGGKKVLCLKRYDRVTDAGGNIIRIHQEDTCQALGRYPHQKYQADGGPSAAEIVKLLHTFSDDRDDDISRFIMALALNWVIAGTDAHSKNYSLLHAAGSFLKLAPFYDLASYLPYLRDVKSTKVKLAMKVGGTYRLHQIGPLHWNKWAVEAGIPTDWVKVHVQTLIHELTDALEPTRSALAESSDSPFLDKLTNAIAARARSCAVLMES